MEATQSLMATPRFSGRREGGAGKWCGAWRSSSACGKRFHWSNMRGCHHCGRGRSPTVRSRVPARGVRHNPRRPATIQSTAAQLVIVSAQDRYKFTLNIWRCVTIETIARYYVRYYGIPPQCRVARKSAKWVCVIHGAWLRFSLVMAGRERPVTRPDPVSQTRTGSTSTRAGAYRRSSFGNAIYRGCFMPSVHHRLYLGVAAASGACSFAGRYQRPQPVVAWLLDFDG